MKKHPLHKTETSQTQMLEGLFLAVAGAVFSYVIEYLEPAEQIKKWLGREPATLAFKKALARAYTAFARQYPEYAASLFDKSFLAGAGAPELAKLLTRHLHPDPALFAQAWGISIGLDIHSPFCNEATKPAADFLKWLESELKSEPVFQPLFDSRALENLSQLEHNVEKLTTELQRGFDAALKTANDYKKVVFEIDGDVKDSNIIAGDHNQITVTKVYNNYFTGSFATLDDYYIPPDAVFQRVRVDEFVGRDWLTAKVDDFLENNKSGIFLLVGDAGVGKTSFLAHLVKERRYLHLFGEQVEGDANVQRALQSLGSQLITRYQIDPYKDRDTLTQLAASPDFLDKLLRLAAGNYLIKNEKIVIVCDALDQAGTFVGGNVLGLPNVLHDNVYFILSQRPVGTKLPNVNKQVETLEAQGSNNLQDMEDYLKSVAKRPEISGQLWSKNYSDNFFVETLKEKSLGVWMYLYYIIEEIGKGSRAPLELENLPTGLAGYYAGYWNDWRKGKNGRGEGIRKWDELYAPLLTTLAAAQEPITIEQLTTWAGTQTHKREATHLLKESWRSFLTIRESQSGTLYAPYHASLRDFLTGKVDVSQLHPAESYLVQDLTEQTKEAHKRIVNVFREECNGVWQNLVTKEYPRLHLTTHLAEAEEYRTLVNLLTEGDKNIAWAEARYGKEETYAGFLSDLEYIWRYAEQKNDLVLCIHCMLIENSIHSLATNIPSDLLVELAKSGLWSIPRCLTTINHMSSSGGRQAETFNKIAEFIPSSLHRDAISIAEKIGASSILALIPYIDDSLRLENLEKAAAAINKIKFDYTRYSEFIKVIALLDNKNKPEALESLLKALNQIRDNDGFPNLLRDIAPLLEGDYTIQVLTTIKGIKKDRERGEALTRLLPYLDNNLLASATIIAQEISDPENRAHTLASLIPYLQDNKSKSDVIDQALTAKDEITDDYWRTLAFIHITSHFDNNSKEEATRKIIKMIQSFPTIYQRDIFRDDYIEGTLSNLIPHLISNDLKLQVVSIVREIDREDLRTYLLIKLASYSNDEIKLMILAEIEKIKNSVRRIRALTDLIPNLSTNEVSIILQEVLLDAQRLDDDYSRTSALISILPYLNDHRKTDVSQEILIAALKTEDEDIRARILTDFLPLTSGKLRIMVLQNLLLTTKRIKDDENRVEALSTLTPHLNNDIKSKVKREVIEIIENLKDGYVRARALNIFTPYIDHSLGLQAINIAKGIRDEEERTQTLINLLPYLEENLKPDARIEAFTASKKIKGEAFRARTIIKLISHLTDNLKPQALISILEAIERISLEDMDSVNDRSGIFETVSPYLNDDLKHKALLIIQKTKLERSRASDLSALSPYIGKSLQPLALVIAQGIKDYSYRSQAFIALAPYLDDNTKRRIIQKALEDTSKITDNYSQARSFINLIPNLNENQKLLAIREIIASAQKIKFTFSKIQTLTSLLPYLDDNLKQQVLEEALTTIETLEDKNNYDSLLTNLVPYINGSLISRIFMSTRNIANERQREQILVKIFPYLDNASIPEAFTIAEEISDINVRTNIYSELIPYLNDEYREKLLTLNQENNVVYYSTIVFVALLPYLKDGVQTSALQKAITGAREIPWGYYRAKVLNDLVNYAEGAQKTELLQEMLSAALEIDDEETRSKELTKYSALFEGTTQASALGNALLSAKDDFIKVIIEEWQKINFLGIEEFIYRLLKKTAQQERRVGLSILSKLSPAIGHFGDHEIYEQTVRAIRDTARWWP